MKLHPSFIVRQRTGQFLCLTTLLLISRTLLANPVALDPMSYETVAAARAAWVARGGAPPVHHAPHHERGIVFPCPFSSGAERFHWDRRVSMDLRAFNGFEVDLSCEQPSGIRALSIYLKSGAGWYHWSGPLVRSGRQILTIMKSDFEQEGSPAGWHHIESIRISPWRGRAIDTALTIHALEARNNHIVVLQGTRSLPRNEQGMGRRAARRISSWLQQTGVPHDRLTEDEVIERGLGAPRLVILPYNAQLPTPLLRRIQRFVERGGRLIVFYSSDAELASLMRFRLGPYKASAVQGQYAAMVFPDPETWHVPERIVQESWNIRPVYPADSSASIVARWHDIEGNNTGEPAWLAGPFGLWMTHILLDDDAPAKQRLLLGLIARYQPDIWHRAAWFALHRAGRIASTHSMGEAIQLIEQQSRETVISQRMTRTQLRRARGYFNHMLNHYEAKRYAEVIDHYYRLHETLTDAYARVQSPRAGEFSGVWDHSGLGLYPGNWNRSARLLAQHGITAIFPNIAWGYLAHYPSTHLPESRSAQRHGDALAGWIRAGRRHNLEVHAWIVCWNLTGAPAEEVARLRREQRLTTTASGEPYPWLNPAHPANRALLLSVVREIASNYPVDGIHLDYIRFPGRQAGYCQVTRRHFEQSLGRPVAQWPADVLPNGALAGAFEQWRARIITDIVAEVRHIVRTTRPEARLSAAVFGAYPECLRTQGQDWGLWLRRGLVDFVTPMNYTEDSGEFRRLLQAQIALPNAAGRIYPGLGVTANESRLTADQVIEQILISRAYNTPGYLLFDFNPTLRDRILPYLRHGITRGR